MYFFPFYKLRNFKIKTISITYGLVCHISFILGGFCMFWGLYNGLTVSVGSLIYPYNIIGNFILLVQFPILHSFLLSKPGRKVLRLLAPSYYGRTLETTVYATIASLQLLILFMLWTPSYFIVYEIYFPYNLISSLLYLMSWILLSISSLQAGYKVQTGSLGWTSMLNNQDPIYPAMPSKGLFSLTRQPIYLSFCLVLWTPPIMTLDLLILAVSYSIYCYFAPKFKERRFVQFYGESFLRYKKNVPYFFPSMKKLIKKSSLN